MAGSGSVRTVIDTYQSSGTENSMQLVIPPTDGDSIVFFAMACDGEAGSFTSSMESLNKTGWVLQTWLSGAFPAGGISGYCNRFIGYINHYCPISTSKAKTVTTTPEGFTIGKSGTRLYYNDVANDTVYQWNMSTAFDVSTLTYSSSMTVSAGGTGEVYYGFRVTPDGTRAHWVQNSSPQTLWQRDLNTAYELSGGYSNQTSVSFSGTPCSINFADNGYTCYVGCYPELRQYTCSTAYDITTLSGTYYSHSVGSYVYCVEFNSSGSQMFIGYGADRVRQGKLTVPFDLSSGITLVADNRHVRYTAVFVDDNVDKFISIHEDDLDEITEFTFDDETTDTLTYSNSSEEFVGIAVELQDCISTLQTFNRTEVYGDSDTVISPTRADTDDALRVVVFAVDNYDGPYTFDTNLTNTQTLLSSGGGSNSMGMGFGVTTRQVSEAYTSTMAGSDQWACIAQDFDEIPADLTTYGVTANIALDATVSLTKQYIEIAAMEGFATTITKGGLRLYASTNITKKATFKVGRPIEVISYRYELDQDEALTTWIEPLNTAIAYGDTGGSPREHEAAFISGDTGTTNSQAGYYRYALKPIRIRFLLKNTSYASVDVKPYLEVKRYFDTTGVHTDRRMLNFQDKTDKYYKPWQLSHELEIASDVTWAVNNLCASLDETDLTALTTIETSTATAYSTGTFSATYKTASGDIYFMLVVRRWQSASDTNSTFIYKFNNTTKAFETVSGGSFTFSSTVVSNGEYFQILEGDTAARWLMAENTGYVFRSTNDLDWVQDTGAPEDIIGSLTVGGVNYAISNELHGVIALHTVSGTTWTLKKTVTPGYSTYYTVSSGVLISHPTDSDIIIGVSATATYTIGASAFQYKISTDTILYVGAIDNVDDTSYVETTATLETSYIVDDGKIILRTSALGHRRDFYESIYDYVNNELTSGPEPAGYDWSTYESIPIAPFQGVAGGTFTYNTETGFPSYIDICPITRVAKYSPRGIFSSTISDDTILSNKLRSHLYRADVSYHKWTYGVTTNIGTPRILGHGYDSTTGEVITLIHVNFYDTAASAQRFYTAEYSSYAGYNEPTIQKLGTGTYTTSNTGVLRGGFTDQAITVAAGSEVEITAPFMVHVSNNAQYYLEDYVRGTLSLVNIRVRDFDNLVNSETDIEAEYIIHVAGQNNALSNISGNASFTAYVPPVDEVHVYGVASTTCAPTVKYSNITKTMYGIAQVTDHANLNEVHVAAWDFRNGRQTSGDYDLSTNIANQNKHIVVFPDNYEDHRDIPSDMTDYNGFFYEVVPFNVRWLVNNQSGSTKTIKPKIQFNHDDGGWEDLDPFGRYSTPIAIEENSSLSSGAHDTYAETWDFLGSTGFLNHACYLETSTGVRLFFIRRYEDAQIGYIDYTYSTESFDSSMTIVSDTTVDSTQPDTAYDAYKTFLVNGSSDAFLFSGEQHDATGIRQIVYRDTPADLECLGFTAPSGASFTEANVACGKSVQTQDGYISAIAATNSTSDTLYVCDYNSTNDTFDAGVSINFSGFTNVDIRCCAWFEHPVSDDEIILVFVDTDVVPNTNLDFYEVRYTPSTSTWGTPSYLGDETALGTSVNSGWRYSSNAQTSFAAHTADSNGVAHACFMSRNTTGSVWDYLTYDGNTDSFLMVATSFNFGYTINQVSEVNGGNHLQFNTRQYYSVLFTKEEEDDVYFRSFSFRTGHAEAQHDLGSTYYDLTFTRWISSTNKFRVIGSEVLLQTFPTSALNLQVRAFDTIQPYDDWQNTTQEFNTSGTYETANRAMLQLHPHIAEDISLAHDESVEIYAQLCYKWSELLSSAFSSPERIDTVLRLYDDTLGALPTATGENFTYKIKGLNLYGEVTGPNCKGVATVTALGTKVTQVPESNIVGIATVLATVPLNTDHECSAAFTIVSSVPVISTKWYYIGSYATLICNGSMFAGEPYFIHKSSCSMSGNAHVKPYTGYFTPVCP